MKDDERPIALKAYEELAERYAAIAESKAENGFIEHPAMRKQLGPVAGLKVLDAGCGPGFLVAHLVAQGATVSAFDISPKMIELARRRVGDRADFFVTDMAQPLPILDDETFDIIVSSLAVDYVRDWTVPFAEFWRVLKPNGRFVFSVQHPLGAYLWYKPPTAFGVQYVEAQWRGFGGEPIVVPDYYRSFEEMVNPLIRSGFIMREIVETKPISSLNEHDPERFEKYSRQPTFMIFDAVKTIRDDLEQ